MRAVREHVVPALVNIPAVRHRILTAISQLSIGYRASPLSVDADDQERGCWAVLPGGFRPATASRCDAHGRRVRCAGGTL